MVDRKPGFSLLQKFRSVSGIMLVALALVVIEIISQTPYRLTATGPIYLTVLAIATVMSGATAGMVGVVLIIMHALSYYSLPDQLGVYTQSDAIRLVLIFVSSPIIVAIVGQLKGRADRAAALEVENSLLAEREIARKALLASETRLQEVLEASGVVAWEWTLADDRVVYTANFADLFGLPRGESLVQQAEQTYSMLAPEWAGRLRAEVARAVAERGKYSIDVPFPDAAAGQTMWLQINGRVIVDETGQPARIRGTLTDITQRHLAEERVRSSDQRVRQLMDNLFVFVGMMSLDGTLVEANRTALEAASLQPEDVIGKPFDQTYWWAYSPQVQAQLRDAIRRAVSGEVVRYDVEVRLAEDRFITIDFNLAPVRDENGVVSFLIPSGIDITERIQAEKVAESLRTSLQQSLEMAQVSVWVYDLAQGEVTLSDSSAQILGLQPETRLLKFAELSQAIYADDLEAFRHNLSSVEASLGPYIAQLRWTRPLDNRMIWLEVRTAIHRDEQGRVVRMHGVMVDVTERQRTAEELRLSNERFRTTLEGAPVTVFNQDRDLRYTWIHNPKLNYQQVNVLGRTDIDLTEQLEDGLRLHALKRGVIETGVGRREEVTIASAGVPYVFDLTIEPLRSPSGEVIGVTCASIDITERRQMEDDLIGAKTLNEKITSTIPDIVYIYDLQTEANVYVNRPVWDYLGYTGDQYEQMGVDFPVGIFNVDDYQRLQARRAELLALRDGEIFEAEYRLRHADGTWRWFLSRDTVFMRSTEGVLRQTCGVAQDITARKEAEAVQKRLTAEIEHQQHRLAALVSDVPGVVWEAWGEPDKATQRINFVSDYVYTMLGYTVEEWLATPNFWLTIVHPEDREKAAAASAEHFRSGGAGMNTFRWMTKSGQILDVEAQSKVITDKHGKPIGMRGVTMDVTARKQAEVERAQLLRQRAEALALVDALFTTAPIGLAFFDTEMRFQRINHALARANFRTIEEHLGRRLPDLFQNANVQIMVDAFDLVLRTERANSFEISYPTTLVAGGIRYYGVTYYPVRLDSEVIGVGAIVQDVTEPRRYQVELMQSLRDKVQALAQVDAFFSNAPFGLSFFDTELRFRRINPMLAEVNGLPVEAHIGHTMDELFPSVYSVQLEDLLQRVIRTRKAEVIELETEPGVVSKNRRVWQITYYPVTSDQTVLGVGAMVQDITERKEVEAERAELLRLETAAREEAERADRLKIQFLGMVSHELRTPLTSIKGFATTLLADDISFDADSQREFVGIINEEADKLTDLVEQLLDVSRLHAGTLRINPMNLQLTEVVNIAQAQLLALTPNHPFTIDLSEDLPHVMADSQRIAEVLVNLVGNAAKYSPEGSPIVLRARQLNDNIRVDVIDQGIGIPESERDAVFEAFRQVERKFENQKGAGLGLAICKGLIEAHEGRIWIEDGAQGGTVISFTLPIVREHARV